MKRRLQKRLLTLAADIMTSIPNVNSYSIHSTLSKAERDIRSIRYDITIK